jgi:hypothetical protein
VKCLIWKLYPEEKMAVILDLKRWQTDFDSDGKLVQYFAMIEDITVKKNVAFTNRI